MDTAAVFAADLSNLGDRETYLDAAGQLLLKLFPSDHAAWNSLDLPAGRAEVVTYPHDSRADVPKMMLEMHAEHPLIASLQTGTAGGDRPPLRLSDFISDLELYRTRAFQEGLSLLCVNRQLILFTAGSRLDFFHCWSMNRWNHDFSDNELALAQHVQPMLQLLDSAYAGPPHKAAGIAVADAYSLTAREQQIMRLLSQGLKALAIGRLLGCSPRTVAKHIEHAYAKLGSNNRVDALRRLRGEF
jgi:DNA-binding CsgD family transcriptional regulator